MAQELKQGLCVNLEGWHGEGGREGEMYGQSNMETYITTCKIDSQMGICSMSQETRKGALYQPIGVGWGGRR